MTLRPRKAVVTASDDLAPRLLTLARPLVPMDGTADLDDWHNALAMASSGWNASVLHTSMDEVLAAVDTDAETRDQLRLAMEGIVAHKRILFDDDQRVVLSWKLIPPPPGGQPSILVSAGELTDKR